MSNITVPAKSYFQESIGARSIFIKSIENDAAIDIEVFFQDGTSERQEIEAGSKFNSPDQIIDEVVFHNNTAADVDIIYQFSKLLTIDKAKVIGDVNALTKFENLTKDENRFYGGLYAPAYGATIYGQIGFYNPPTSNVMSYIDVLRLGHVGEAIQMYELDSTTAALYNANANVKNKKMSGANGKTYRLNAFLATTTIGASMGVAMSTDLYGTPAQLDFKNSPIALAPGEGIGFGGSVNKALTVFAELFEESL